MRTLPVHPWLITIFGLLVIATAALHGEERELPPFSEVRATVESYFATQKDRGPGDLISRSDVLQVLSSLRALGWHVPDEKELLASLLDDQHIVVRSLRSPAGRRFMSKVAHRALIYDRLDRISEVSGGARLIQDLVKLPDGEKYAKPRSGGGVPDLLDLLPKIASGKTRRIADYDKPTGRIYTVAGLLDHLAASYERTKKDST